MLREVYKYSRGLWQRRGSLGSLRFQVVVLIGSSATAFDISRDISKHAKEVHIASRSDPLETPRKNPNYDNLWHHSMIERDNEDGTLVFQDGISLLVDVILHCTGYKYHFPFLQTDGFVSADDNRVGPLYKHIFPHHLPRTLFHWNTMDGVLSGQVALPTDEEMMEDVNNFYREIEVAGCPKRYTHNLGARQFEYDDWLSEKCGYPAVEEWRRQMYDATWKNECKGPEVYRDVWDDDLLILQAHEGLQIISW